MTNSFYLPLLPGFSPYVFTVLGGADGFVISCLPSLVDDVFGGGVGGDCFSLSFAIIIPPEPLELNKTKPENQWQQAK